MILGGIEASTNNHFDGFMDEVALFNRALSDNEIGEIFNGVPEPSIFFLIALSFLSLQKFCRK